MYGLPDADRHALEAVCGSEKLMYCVPFNIEGDRFVRGYLAIPDKRIYKLLDGEVLLTVNIEGSDDFRVEVMYGSCGFYVRTDGVSRLVCRFISGRNLARYSPRRTIPPRSQTTFRSVSVRNAADPTSTIPRYARTAWTGSRSTAKCSP